MGCPIPTTNLFLYFAAMNTAIDQLSASIFNKSLQECSEEELQLLTQQYPWFAPAQLLYAKKLQASGSPLYEDQVQKTSLYFQNRLWLQHLLDNNSPSENGNTPSPVPEEKITSSIPAAIVGTPAIDTPVTDKIELPEPSASTTETSFAPVEAGTETPEEVVEIRPAAGEPVQEISHEPEQEPIIPGTIQQETSEEAEEAKEVDEETAESEIDTAVNTDPPLEIPGLKMEPIDSNSKNQLVFEPYHTVDYFASQGIRFKEDDKPADRFGHQLRSFTEWLKTLRRTPASELDKTGADPVGEKKVEQLAEHSLAERHVVTEAMAEVWIKQGNRAKAEEIYRKLSLLEPLKTAYFAAKIEDLKKTS